MTRASWPLRIFGVIVVGFLVLPTLIIIPMSFSAGRTLRFPPADWSTRWYDNLLTSEAWTEAAMTSLRVGLLTAVVATLLGTAAALALDRDRFRGQSVAQMVILSPMIIPVVIVAIALYSVFVRWRLAGSITALVVAHTVLAIPFVVINVAAALRTVDRDLELAAANLGASPWRVFRNVTLPAIAPGILTGALFAFITSWDEVVVAAFLTSPDLRTLPVVMWSQVRTEVDPTIAAAASLLTLLTIVLFAAAAALIRWQGRRRAQRGPS
jgi:putative spermidine/putrescine transport system permease protein